MAMEAAAYAPAEILSLLLGVESGNRGRRRSEAPAYRRHTVVTRKYMNMAPLRAAQNEAYKKRRFMSESAKSRDATQLVSNDASGAPTLVDMGASFAIVTGGVLTLTIAATPNASSVWVRVVDEASGAVFEQEVATDLPAANQFLAPRLFMNNGATAAAVQNLYTLAPIERTGCGFAFQHGFDPAIRKVRIVEAQADRVSVDRFSGTERLASTFVARDDRGFALNQGACAATASTASPTNMSPSGSARLRPTSPAAG